MALREAVGVLDKLRALSVRKQQLQHDLQMLVEKQTSVWNQLQLAQQHEDELLLEMGHVLTSAENSPIHQPLHKSILEADTENNSSWKKPRTDVHLLQTKPLTIMRSATIKEAQIRVAVQIKASFPDPLENAPGGKNLLRSTLLAGQPVEYRKQGQAVGFGVVAPNNVGTVICKCVDCQGLQEVSLSLFEAHSGSTLRRPAEFTYLTNYNISIKELLALVNSEEVIERYSKCQLCRASGDELLRCDKCGCAFHADCLGFNSQGQEDPPCPACVQKASLFMSQGSGGHYSTCSMTELAKSPKPVFDVPTSLGFADESVDTVACNGMSVKDASRVRNKRLFLKGSGLLVEGERLKYQVGDKVILEGMAVLGDVAQPGGIRCNCCSQVISCSAFEQHAGYGSRRAPYDHIITSKGLSLKCVADQAMESINTIVNLKQSLMASPPSPRGMSSLQTPAPQLLATIDNPMSAASASVHSMQRPVSIPASQQHLPTIRHHINDIQHQAAPPLQ